MSTTNVKPAKEKLDPLVVKAAIILVIGSLAPMLDSTMVNVAVKSITVDFKTTVAVIQWVITGYVLAMGIAIPISGWANNRFGGKRIFMFSLIAFLAGSLLSALSWNIGSMIVFRVIQGLAAGLMMPTMQSMLVQISGGKHLGQLISYVSIPAALGPILGPVLGGVIINSLSWRWIFYVNVPVTIVAFLMAWRGLPKVTKSDHKVSLDWIGISMLSPAFALLIYGIIQISTHGGIASSAVFVPLMIGVALMVAFVVYALRRKGTPVLDLRLFRSMNFSVSCILLFLAGLIMNGGMLLLPLYYQQVRGESVLYTGLFLIPQGVGMMATRGWFGKLTDRIGSRLIVLVGLVVTVLGTLPFAFAGASTNQVLLAAALLVRGAGLGAIMIPIFASAYVGIEKTHIPDASTTTRILQTIGGAFGSAILATVIQHQLTVHQTMKAAQAVVGAYNVAFWWSIGFTVISIIPALLLPMHKNAPEIKPVPQANGNEQ
jgi:EmrB/QacA subfamily drug resistance transporter